MRYIFTTLMLLLFFQDVHCQHNRQHIQKIAEVFFDTSRIASMRRIVAYNLPPEEKKAVIADFNTARQKYFNEFIAYYSKTYTPDETQIAFEFYTTDTGKKLANDLNVIYNSRFPKNNSWYIRTAALKKNIATYNQHVTDDIQVQLPDAAGNTVAGLINLNAYLNASLENHLYDLPPQYVSVFTCEYNKLAINYTTEIEKHFRDNYSVTEIEEITKFYTAPVGKKIKLLSPDMAMLILQARNNWSQNYLDIHYNIQMGKYKKQE